MAKKISAKLMEISSLIDELEKENETLKKEKEKEQKNADKALQNSLGISLEQLSEFVQKSNEKTSEFESRIIEFFDLNSEENKSRFLEVFCSEKSLYYWHNNK